MSEFLMDATAVVSTLDELYHLRAVPLRPGAVGLIHAWIFRTGCPVQVLDLIACDLDNEYYHPSAAYIISCIMQTLTNTRLDGFPLAAAVAAQRRSRAAAAA